MKPYLTDRQLKILMDATPYTINKYADLGLIPGAHRVGNRWVFEEAEIRAWLEANNATCPVMRAALKASETPREWSRYERFVSHAKVYIGKLKADNRKLVASLRKQKPSGLATKGSVLSAGGSVSGR